jgi:outer membrane protein OmpA-like peptidoglycan-associated protein
MKNGSRGARGSLPIFAVVAFCLPAIVGLGLFLLPYSRVLARHNATSSRTSAVTAFSSAPVSVASVHPAGASSGAATRVPPALLATSSSLAATKPPSPTTNAIASVNPSAVIPKGTNIAAFDFGGEVESVSGGYGGPGLKGEVLIDGMGQTNWQPDIDVDPPNDYHDLHAVPADIVFSFYKRDTALVSAVVVETDPKSPGPDAVEIWVSADNSATKFKSIAAAQLSKTLTTQTISFRPVLARYVKVRIISGQPDTLAMRQIQIIEGKRAGYTSLLTRHPDILKWKTNVRYAAQKGIDWLEPAAMDWQEHKKCFGCHVQAQTMMGLAIAQTNDYVVNAATLRALIDFTCSKQQDDGHELDEGAGNKLSPTHFAAMGLAYYDEANDVKKDATLVRYVDWMDGNIDPSGAYVQDFIEPPVEQGSIDSTANAAFGFMEAYAQTGNAKYKTDADRGIVFLTSQVPQTTEDENFEIIALSHFGNSKQRQAIPQIVKELFSQQNKDGGWQETKDMKGSNPFATGQVLYALKQAGVSINSPQFVAGVRYLLKTQEPSGDWPSVNSQSDRPSEFAPTMWAVIGLAGSYSDVEEPTAKSIKEELDKTGRAILYINFDFNKATIRPDGKPIIAEVLKMMKQYPNLALSIDGYTDNIGSYDYNIKLSGARAAAVVDALVQGGIVRTRLDSAGHGFNNPIADNSTPKGRAKNRRVELVRR